MSIILQTMVTNKLDQSRKLSYLGNKGVTAPGGKAIIVEGAYPCACRSPQQRQAMEYEYENGMIDICLVTNLRATAPIVAYGGVAIPAAVQAASDKAAPTPFNVVKSGTTAPLVTAPIAAESKGDKPSAVVGSSTNAFASGSIEDNLPKSVSIGADAVSPAKMSEPAKDMFGANAVTEVNANKPVESTPVVAAKKPTIVDMTKDTASVGKSTTAEAPKVEEVKAPIVEAPVENIAVKVEAPVIEAPKVEEVKEPVKKTASRRAKPSAKK